MLNSFTRALWFSPNGGAAPGATTTKPEEDPSTGNPEETSEVDAETDEAFDQERAMTLIRKLRAEAREAGKLKKRLGELEADAQQRKEAEMTELQKAQSKAEELNKRLQTLETQRRAQEIRHAVELTATRLGFASPEDAYTLADLSAVEVSEEGQVKGVEAALKELLNKKPYLKANQQKPPEIDASKGGSLKPPSPEEIVTRKRQEYPGL